MYYLIVTIHVLAAIFWLGGVFYLALVGAPVLRGVEPPQLRAELFRRIGVRSRALGWAAIVVLLVTGVLNLQFHGVLSSALGGSPGFWSTRYGFTLAWKLAAVGAMLTVQALHDFVYGVAASRAEPGSPAALRLRRASALLARASALLGVVIVIAAVRLARGG
jgi:putative copper resistance protein D